MEEDIMEMPEFGDRKKYGEIGLWLVREEEPMSPREWDNLGTFAMYHHRYDYGDKKAFDNPQDLVSFIKENDCVWLPVYMIDHSGIAFRTRSFAEDPQGWDSGQVGVIYVTPEKIAKEYGADTPENRKIALECLEGEIKVLNDYAQGNIYGYELKIDDDVVESCWGFYPDEDGRPTDAIDEAIAAYDGFVENFATPEAAKEYVGKDGENFFNVPDELRTAELTKVYLDNGGDVRRIPERYQEVTFKPC